MMLWVARMVAERFHRDDEGRPIREGRTPAEYLAPGDIDYKPCAYPGSRAGRPMNVSALRQAAAHWDEILDAQALLRVAYTQARGAYAPDVMDLWRVSQLGSALPWFFILRGAVTPAFAAALSKVTLGMGILAQRLLAQTLAERWVAPALSARTLLELAESTQTLIGPSEVCSAPERMLEDYFEVFVTPSPVVRGTGGVAALVAARDDVLRFGAHYAGFKLVLWIYGLARRFVYADLEAALAGRVCAAELAALRDAPVEPPDFFSLEPEDPAAVPAAARAAWLAGLADLIVSMAPDGSDARLGELARRIASTLGERPPPQQPLAEEVPADARERVARAVVALDELDATFAEVGAHVEAGFRRSAGAEPFTEEIDAAARDRILIAPPRGLIAALAPR